MGVKRFLFLTLAGLVSAVLALVLWASLAPTESVAPVLLSLERSRGGLELKEIEAGGFRIAYLEGGSGEPLVLVHGMGGDKDHWVRVAPYLTPHFRVIAIDAPGFGESDRRADAHYTAADQVANLHAFVAALGLDTFHLGGNSMGGLISAKYAAAYPNDVKSLWLLAPGGVGGGPTGELAGLKPGDAIPLLVRSPDDVERVMGYAMSRPPFIPGAVKDLLGTRAAADYELHSRIFHELGAEWAGEALERTMAGNGTAARIVWGEQDRLLPVRDAEVLHAAMPNSSLLLLPGVGHVPQFEAAKQVADDYIAFVDALPRS